MNVTQLLRKLLLITLCLSVTEVCDAGETFKNSWDAPLIADTEDAACNVLKEAVAKQLHLSANTPLERHWFCDFARDNQYFRIVALRVGDCDAPSCLLGWYAVMRRSPAVLEWDVAEERLVPLAEYVD